jgi:hypothetical protein
MLCLDQEILPGLENQFALPFVRRNKPTNEQIARYRLISDEALHSAISAHKVNAVVVRPGRLQPGLRKILKESGFRGTTIEGHLVFIVGVGD